MRQRVSRFLGQPGPRAAAAEQVGQLAQRGEQVDDAEARNSTAHEVVGQQGAQGRDGFDEVVPIPEGGPRNEDQQQPCLDEQGDDQQTSEQIRLPLCLRFREAGHTGRGIPIAAGLNFELGEDGQRPGVVFRLLERLGQTVKQSVT
jgi:hypothetical protein